MLLFMQRRFLGEPCLLTAVCYPAEFMEKLVDFDLVAIVAHRVCGRDAARSVHDEVAA